MHVECLTAEMCMMIMHVGWSIVYIDKCSPAKLDGKNRSSLAIVILIVKMIPVPGWNDNHTLTAMFILITIKCWILDAKFYNTWINT